MLYSRRKYYENLDLTKITDNKKFWNTVKPFLSNKTSISQKISLKEENEIVTDDKEVANIFNKHFIDPVKNLANTGGCNALVLEKIAWKTL